MPGAVSPDSCGRKTGTRQPGATRPGEAPSKQPAPDEADRIATAEGREEPRGGPGQETTPHGVGVRPNGGPPGPGLPASRTGQAVCLPADGAPPQGVKGCPGGSARTVPPNPTGSDPARPLPSSKPPPPGDSQTHRNEGCATSWGRWAHLVPMTGSRVSLEAA